MKNKILKITLFLSFLIGSVQLTNAQCANQGSGPTQDFDCDGITNENDLDDDNDGILDVDEGVLTNAATSGTASQSSFNTPSDNSSRAIDGNTDGVFNNGSVSHTNNFTSTEYWNLDLGSAQLISEIKFFNRTDCCSDRISNVHLFVSSTPFPTDVNDLAGSQTNAEFTFQFASNETSAQVSIPVNQSGRYVRLQKSGNNNGSNVLSIAELQVFVQPDTDGDGLANSMDLDSDGDGCADALEGDGSFTTLDLDTDDSLSGGVDTDGVPNIAGAPQGIGTAYDDQVNFCDNPLYGNVQIGIGTTTPDASAALDVTATDKGFLPPRMTTVDRDAIATPAEGLTIYNTVNKCIEFWNGTNWISACDGSIQ